MMGSHDRRLAKLEGALPNQPIISEDELLIAEIVLGTERANQLRHGCHEDFATDERQQMIAAIQAELTRRDVAGSAR
jgi:hypothetical protein